VPGRGLRQRVDRSSIGHVEGADRQAITMRRRQRIQHLGISRFAATRQHARATFQQLGNEGQPEPAIGAGDQTALHHGFPRSLPV